MVRYSFLLLIFVKDFYYYIGLNFYKFIVFIKILNSYYRFFLGKFGGNICC